MSAKRVLIVPMRWPLAERLRAEGCEVVEADTVDDAVEQAGAGVDAVLLDARMPDEAALEVLSGVRGRDYEQGGGLLHRHGPLLAYHGLELPPGASFDPDPQTNLKVAPGEVAHLPV